MKIKIDFHRMCYVLILERDEVTKAFSDVSEFDKLITEIGKKLWEIRSDENIFG